MIYEKIAIQAKGYEDTGFLYTYFHDISGEYCSGRIRPVIIICPGGGYEITSDREAEPIALRFLAMGYNAAVLRYSVLPSRYPVALLQLAQSVKFLKENADRYHIDPDKIVIQGCSAGGHLAGNLAVSWNGDFLLKSLKTEPEILRPAGLILCYPVISAGRMGHKGSFLNLLGDRYDELKDFLSLENRVTKYTPRTFIWHTATDESVAVENSISFFEALRKEGVSAELHIYPVGTHGLSLADQETMRPDGTGVQMECASWIDLAEEWMKHI